VPNKLEPTITSVSPTDIRDTTIEDLRSALTIIPSDEYHIWISIALALKSLGQDCFWLFLEWSQKSGKYDFDVCQKVWADLKPISTNYKYVFNLAYEYGWKPEKKSPIEVTQDKPLLFDIKKLLENPIEPVFLVDGVIEANTTGALIGESGAGKSFVALDLAASVATGNNFCNLPTKQGRWSMNQGDHYSNNINRLTSKTGLRGKIGGKCCECTYDSYQEGTWRKQVENCTSRTCPLFSVRSKSQTCGGSSND